MTTMKKLIDVKGISEAKAQKIQQAAMKLVPMGFTSVFEVAPFFSSYRQRNILKCARMLYIFPQAARNWIQSSGEAWNPAPLPNCTGNSERVKRNYVIRCA